MQLLLSQLLPDGHLYCPKEWSLKKNAFFKVIVLFQDPNLDASDHDLELAALKDSSADDFLSQEELDYYLTLEDNLFEGQPMSPKRSFIRLRTRLRFTLVFENFFFEEIYQNVIYL